MEINTEYNLGDKVFYEGIYCTLEKDCPCCGGDGQIVGKDGKKYRCPDSCDYGKSRGYNIYGIYYAEITGVSVNVYTDRRRDSCCIRAIGIILKENIDDGSFKVSTFDDLESLYWFDIKEYGCMDVEKVAREANKLKIVLEQEHNGH